jgi:hypothetical protein
MPNTKALKQVFKKLKQALCAIICATFFLPFIVSAEFLDIADATSANDPAGYFEALKFIKSAKIADGYSDGTFRPGNKINRAEFTKIVINAFYGAQAVENCDKSKIKFPDVPHDSWFAPFVCVALTDGILQGYPDGTFKPARDISFVEAAKIIVVASEITQNGTFSQSVSSPWYKVFVDYLEAKKAIPLDVLSLDQRITRGEMAEIIYRILTRKEDKNSLKYDEIPETSAKEKTDFQDEINEKPTQNSDKSDELKLVEANKNPVVDEYKFAGEAVLVGDFFHVPKDSAENPDSICVKNLDAQSILNLPNLGKTKDMQICFAPDELVKAVFGGEGAKGKAKFTIDSYTVYLFPADNEKVSIFVKLKQVEEIYPPLLSLEEDLLQLIDLSDPQLINLIENASQASKSCDENQNSTYKEFVLFDKQIQDLSLAGSQKTYLRLLIGACD